MAKRIAKHVDTVVTDRVTSLAHNQVDRVSKRAAGLERKARVTARLAAKKAEGARGELHEETNRRVDAVATMVKNRPVMSTAIAAAAGLLALTVLRR